MLQQLWETVTMGSFIYELYVVACVALVALGLLLVVVTSGLSNPNRWGWALLGVVWAGLLVGGLFTMLVGLVSSGSVTKSLSVLPGVIREGGIFTHGLICVVLGALLWSAVKVFAPVPTEKARGLLGFIEK